MLKLICSFADSFCKFGDEKTGIKRDPKEISQNASLGRNANPNNIGALDLLNLSEKLANKLVSTGVDIVGGLLGTLGLIHMRNLHPLISLVCGVVFKKLNYYHHNEAHLEEHNWANVASYSFLAAASFGFVARARDVPFTLEKAETIASQLLVSNIILSSIVFGASSLYAKYSVKPSVYYPAFVGGAVGAAFISIIPSSNEWKEHALISMSNVLPILSLGITYACMSVVITEDDNIVLLENGNHHKDLKNIEQAADTKQVTTVAEDKLVAESDSDCTILDEKKEGFTQGEDTVIDLGRVAVQGGTLQEREQYTMHADGMGLDLGTV